MLATEHEYDDIARVLHDTRPTYAWQLGNGALAAYYQSKRDLARALAELFKDDPNFDRDTFLRECAP